MSLINKMLQDLDARGGDGARGDASSVVRPVSYGARTGLSPAAIGAVVVALAVLGGGAFAAWKYFRGGPQPVSPSVAAQAPAAVRPAKVPQEEGAIAPSAPITAAPVAPAGDLRADSAQARPRKRGEAGNQATIAHGPGAADGRARVAAAKRNAAPAVGLPAAGAGASVATAAGAGDSSDAGLSSQQKAENEYRRALQKLQDARVSEAIAGLEQAVYLYPRHEAARQTLVSLLVEGGRQPEAIRHLMFATNLDPRQVNMAMLLARLQIENGGNALATLERSLPYAESNADYRALMAGVLQRANRHKEAVDHYQAAVRLQPGNAVWWMGMGISLQTDKRNAEAKAAFQRAHDSGRLSQELQNFVERRLQQLN